jgi:hypothetical protein
VSESWVAVSESWLKCLRPAMVEGTAAEADSRLIEPAEVLRPSLGERIEQ